LSKERLWPFWGVCKTNYKFIVERTLPNFVTYSFGTRFEGSYCIQRDRNPILFHSPPLGSKTRQLLQTGLTCRDKSRFNFPSDSAERISMKYSAVNFVSLLWRGSSIQSLLYRDFSEVGIDSNYTVVPRESTQTSSLQVLLNLTQSLRRIQRGGREIL
jgi:hypothetical protein